MKLFSLIAFTLGIALASALPTLSFATDHNRRPNFETSHQAADVQTQWLAQFGANVRVDSLCNNVPNSALQLLSPSSCEALSRFRTQPQHPYVRSVQIRQLKRDRAVWNAIPRREQRILEQYEVVIIGQAKAVAAQTGAPR